MADSRSVPLRVLRDTARIASTLTAPTVMPTSTDQVSASARATRGSSGFVGGSLPVALVQTKESSLRAAKAADTAASPFITLVLMSSLSLSAIALPPITWPLPSFAQSCHWLVTGLHPAPLYGRRQLRGLLGPPQPVRHRRARDQGQVDGLLQIGTRIHHGRRVGPRATQPPGLVFVQPDDLADGRQGQHGLSRPQRPVPDLH